MKVLYYLRFMWRYRQSARCTAAAPHSTSCVYGWANGTGCDRCVVSYVEWSSWL